MQPLYRATITPESIALLGGQNIIDKVLPGTEVWKNDTYQVTVKRGIDTGQPGITVAHLSIKRIDQQALPDWRDFQYIKNQLVGEEHEGIELYPPESRLLDTANSYHLWVFERAGLSLNIGFFTRLVTQGELIPGTKQRPFPADRMPADLEQHEKTIRTAYAKALSGEL